MNVSIALVNDLKIRQRNHGEILGCCPVCGCKDANFNTLKLLWRCWHCFARGNITTQDGYVVKEEPEKVLDIPKIRDLYTSITEKYRENIPPKVLSYLINRGVTQNSIDKFKLGFCSAGFKDEYSNPVAEDAGIVYSNYPTLTNRITIPYLVNGETTDLRGRIIDTVFQYKEGTPTYVSLAGSHTSRGADFLFNHDVLSHSDKVIITEGEFKAIVGCQHGFPIVATPGIFGWQHAWSDLFKNKEVTLAADFDGFYGARSPAYLMAKMLYKEIPQLKVALLSIAKNSTTKKVDVDSLLASGNLHLFELVIKAAMPAEEWLKLEGRKYGRKK